MHGACRVAAQTAARQTDGLRIVGVRDASSLAQLVRRWMGGGGSLAASKRWSTN
jgi:hypothetical protein